MRLSPILLAVFAFACYSVLGDTYLQKIHPIGTERLAPHDTIVLLAPVDVSPDLVDHVFSKQEQPDWPYSHAVPFRILDSQKAAFIDNVLSVSKRDSLRLRYSLTYTCQVIEPDTLLLILDGVERGKTYTLFTYGVPYETTDSSGIDTVAYSDEQEWTLETEESVSHIESVFPSSGPLYCGESINVRFSNVKDLLYCVPELDHGLVLQQEQGTPGNVFIDTVFVDTNSGSIDIAIGGTEPGSAFSITLDPAVYSSVQNHALTLNYYVPVENTLVVQTLFQRENGRVEHGMPDTLRYRISDSVALSLHKANHRIAKLEMLYSPFEATVSEGVAVFHDACASTEISLCEVLYIPTSTSSLTIPDHPHLEISVLDQSGQLLGGAGVYTYTDSAPVISVKTANGFEFRGWSAADEWGPIPDAVFNTQSRLSYMARNGGFVALTPNIDVVPPCQEYSMCIETAFTDNFLNSCFRSSLAMPDDIVTTNISGCETYPNNNLVGITAEIAPEYQSDYIIVGYKVNGQWEDFDPPGSSVSAKIRPGHCSSPKNIEIVAIPYENVQVDVTTVLTNAGVANPGVDADYQVRVYQICTEGETLITSSSAGSEHTYYVAPGSSLRVEYSIPNPSESHVSFEYWQHLPGFTHPYPTVPPAEPNVMSFEVVVKEDIAIQGVFREHFHVTDIGFFTGDNREEIAWTAVRDLTQDPITDVDVFSIDGFGMGSYVFVRFSHDPDLESVLHGGLIVDELSQRMDVHRYKLGELESYVYESVSEFVLEDQILQVPIVKQHSIVDNMPTGIPRGELFRVLLRGISTLHANGEREYLPQPIVVKAETEMPGLEIIFKGARVLEHSYDGDVELMHFYKTSLVGAEQVENYYYHQEWNDSSLRVNNIGKLPHHCYDELDKDDYPTTSYDEQILSIEKVKKSEIAFFHAIGFDYDNLDSQCDSAGFIESAHDFYNGVVMDELEGPFEARYLLENLRIDSIYVELTNEGDLLTLLEGAIVVLAAIVTLLLLEGFYQILMGWCPEVLGDRTWAYGRDSWWGAHPSWQHQQDWVKSTDLRHDVQFKLKLEE